MTHVAERATPRANSSHDHEGGGTVPKAFTEIGAIGLLTHRVQAILPQDLLKSLYFWRTGKRGANPGRFAWTLTRISGRNLDRNAGNFVRTPQFFALSWCGSSGGGLSGSGRGRRSFVGCGTFGHELFLGGWRINC